MLKALTLTFAVCLVWNQQQFETVYDSRKDLTTVRLPHAKLADQKDRYHSFSFSIEYSYPGQIPVAPERVNFEIMTVVKARRLNSDLYAVFVVDGKPVHFSSNRSAIRKPVPGRPWVGEKMVFLIPREEFRKLAAAEKLAIKLGGVTFEFSKELRGHVRSFAEGIPR